MFGPAVTIATVRHPFNPTMREYMYTYPIIIEHNKEIYIVNIEHKYDLLILLLEEQNCTGLFTVISEDEFIEIGRS